MNEIEHRTPSYAAAIYGLIIGGALILFDVVILVLGCKGTTMFQNFNLIILITAIYFGTKHYRDTQMGGYMSYSNALGLGTLISFYSSILLAVYSFILFQYIQPGLLDKILELVEQKLVEAGTSDNEIDKAMMVARQVTTPFMLTISTIFSITLWGFIFSLGTSFFVKKEKNPFLDSDEQPKQEQ